MLATLEEQRLDALAYPTLRRKPAIIGEAQIGTTCQLSAATGLPAISMPAGFSLDGLPIGIELLGGAFTEATLLKYAYASEQATRPRRPPFSTPALVHGAGPAAGHLRHGGRRERRHRAGRPRQVHLHPHHRRTPLRRGGLRAWSAPDVVVGLTLQRSEDGQARADRRPPAGAEPGRPAAAC